MKTRTYVLAAGVVAVISAIVLVMVGGREPPAPKVEHGNFSERFQPVPPQASKDAERLAGIGSIRDLRPVQLETR